MDQVSTEMITGEKMISREEDLNYSTTGCAPTNIPWGGVPTDIFSPKKRCIYCDGMYCITAESCPRVKSISYFEDGSISKIVFLEPNRK